MTEKSQKVLAEALLLPPTERAELIEALFSSFEFADRSEVDSAWAKEAEDRIDAYERGLLSSVPVHEVFERLDKPEKS